MPTASPQPPSLDPVQLRISRRQDAADVTARIRALLGSPEPRPPVDIRFDTDTLDGLLLQLGSAADGDGLDITIRGVEGGTVLSGSRLSVVGHDIEVRDLTFVGSAPAGDCLSVTVQGSAALRNLAFTGQKPRLVPGTRRRGGRVHTGALQLRARGRDARAHIDNLAVVDVGLSPAVRIDAQPGGRFARVDIADAVFSAAASPAVEVAATVQIGLHDVRSDAPADLLSTDSPAVLVDGEVTKTADDDPVPSAVRSAVSPSP